jgi:hypothetical protein
MVVVWQGMTLRLCALWGGTQAGPLTAGLAYTKIRWQSTDLGVVLYPP